MEEKPQSKRWIWITGTVLAVLGVYYWIYFDDDVLLPDDNLTPDYFRWRDEENGFELVTRSSGKWEINDAGSSWAQKYFEGKEPWNPVIVQRIFGENAEALAVFEMLDDGTVEFFAAPRESLSQLQPEYGRRVMTLAKLGRLRLAQALVEGNPLIIGDRLRTMSVLAWTFAKDWHSLIDYSLCVFFQKVKGDAINDVLESDFWNHELVLGQLHESVAVPFSRERLKTAWAGEYQLSKRAILEGGDGLSATSFSGEDIPMFFLRKNRTVNMLAEQTLSALRLMHELPVNVDRSILEPDLPSRFMMYAGGNALGEVVVSQFVKPNFFSTLRAGAGQRSRDSLFAVKLALREYYESEGRLPGTLNEVVPTFLAPIPIDSVDGKAIRYDATSALIWSIGENMIDDGGDLNRDDCLELKWTRGNGKPASEARDTPVKRRVILAP